MPAPLLYDKTLQPVVRDTWARLRGLAWGKDETPPLSLEQLCEILGMGHSTLYGHMLILRQRAACSWRAAGNKTLIVSFANPAADHSKNLEKDLSRNLEKPSPSLGLKSKGPKEIEKEPKKQQGGAFQKSGKSKNLESAPPAIEVYREITRLFPEKSLYPMVEQAVGDRSENLERWRATVTGWLAAGYSKKNIAGMLDWYREGKTSKGTPHQEKTNGTHGPKRNDPPGGAEDEPLSEAQLIARRLSGGINSSGAVGGNHGSPRPGG